MSARYRAKNWLHGLEAADFSKFADFILGERVMGLQIPTSDGGQQKLKPDWSIVLAFEHKLRQEAMRLVANEGYTLAIFFSVQRLLASARSFSTLDCMLHIG